MTCPADSFGLTPTAAAWLQGERPRDASTQEADRRRAVAEADMAEMKAAVMRGDLVSVTAVEPIIRRAVTAARTRLMAVPSKLGPVLRPEDPVSAIKELDAAMLEVLGELQHMLDEQSAP